MFNSFSLPVDDWIARFVLWIAGYRSVFRSIREPFDYILEQIESFLLEPNTWLVALMVFAFSLLALKWIGALALAVVLGLASHFWLPPDATILLAIAAVAGALAGWKVALFSGAALLLVGFIGLWTEMMQTTAIVLSAVIFCVLVGVPLGILAARSEFFESLIRPVLDIFQTTPAFVYLVPVVMLFGVGAVPGLLATIVFALPPIIRLTCLGIRQVQKDVVEAGHAFGCTPLQLLIKVQLPLALPTIMTGINQTIMLALSMVVIAGLIGAPGLGATVYEGLNRLNIGGAAIGGVGVVLLAMVLDRVTQRVAKRSEIKVSR
mgnify:CR=1 FL=1